MDRGYIACDSPSLAYSKYASLFNSITFWLTYCLDILYSPTIRVQTEDQQALWQQILDIVNKTNLIDYTMDIRKRLQSGDEMPPVCVAIPSFAVQIFTFSTI